MKKMPLGMAIALLVIEIIVLFTVDGMSENGGYIAVVIINAILVVIGIIRAAVRNSDYTPPSNPPTVSNDTSAGTKPGAFAEYFYSMAQQHFRENRPTAAYSLLMLCKGYKDSDYYLSKIFWLPGEQYTATSLERLDYVCDPDNNCHPKRKYFYKFSETGELAEIKTEIYDANGTVSCRHIFHFNGSLFPTHCDVERSISDTTKLHPSYVVNYEYIYEDGKVISIIEKYASYIFNMKADYTTVYKVANGHISSYEFEINASEDSKSTLKGYYTYKHSEYSGIVNQLTHSIYDQMCNLKARSYCKFKCTAFEKEECKTIDINSVIMLPIIFNASYQ